MNRPVQAVSYRALLRYPGVLRAFTAATIGRLSYATSLLSLLLTVQHATRSYAVAGTALGAYSLASLTMPVKSRLIDRAGQRRVLPVLASVFASVCVTIAVAATAGVSAPLVYLGLSGVVGLAAPPLGPSMRALWAALTPEPAARQRAYSLDGVVEQSLYAVGPVLVGVVVAISSSATALIVTGGLNLLGAAGMATSSAANRHGVPGGARPANSLLGPFTQRGFVPLVLAMLGVGLGAGPVDVAVVAIAGRAGQPGRAGYLLAAVSVGSAVGGLSWGRLHHRRQTSVQLGTLIAATAVGGLAAALAPSLSLLGVALGLVGLVSAPVFIVAYLAADALIPHGGRTEATTWVNTANNAGIALGAAAAGVIVDHANGPAALIGSAAVLAITAAAVLTTRRRLQEDGDMSPAALPSNAQ